MILLINIKELMVHFLHYYIMATYLAPLYISLQYITIVKIEDMNRKPKAFDKQNPYWKALLFTICPVLNWIPCMIAVKAVFTPSDKLKIIERV